MRAFFNGISTNKEKDLTRGMAFNQ
jgi:hypothetical protein